MRDEDDYEEEEEEEEVDFVNQTGTEAALYNRERAQG